MGLILAIGTMVTERAAPLLQREGATIAELKDLMVRTNRNLSATELGEIEKQGFKPIFVKAEYQSTTNAVGRAPARTAWEPAA